MTSRPYLDKLVTSPHIPKQEGQIGYCSRKLIPDLSCTGIHSELEEKKQPVTTADGRMTKVFVLNAYRTMRELQRGITIQNAQEEIFKLDHRQYIDKLLVDMEEEKKSKHARRMRHFKKNKDSLGFGGSFEAYQNSATWEPITATTETNEISGEFEEQHTSPEHGSPYEAARQTAVSRANKQVRINDSGQHHRDRSAKTHSNERSNSLVSAGSLGSYGSQGSVSRQGPAPRLRTSSRMALFNSLLEVVEPPKSPVKRFGSMDFAAFAPTTVPSQPSTASSILPRIDSASKGNRDKANSAASGAEMSR